MKTENLRTVKNQLSNLIEELPQAGPVLVTKSGKARALLIPITDDVDLETVLLSNSPRFWRLWDRSRRAALTQFFTRPRSSASSGNACRRW